jgi:hypothetical protein
MDDLRDDMLLERSRPQSKSSEPPAMQPVTLVVGGINQKLRCLAVYKLLEQG